VEWNIGESAGVLVAFALGKKVALRTVREKKDLLEDFQKMIRSQGIETHWQTTFLKTIPKSRIIH
jgi:hypothetical protein